MSFECSRLEDVAEVIDSLHKTPSYCAQGFPMVRVTDVKYGNLNLSGCHSVDEGTYLEFSRRFKPKAGDIVITRVGTYGVSARVKEATFCLGQNTAAIIPKLINPRYLYAALNSEFVRSQIEAGVVGSTQKTLSLKHIKALNIPRQGDEAEESIAEIIGGLDDRISLLRETNATLEAIAQALFKSWFVDFDPVRAKAEGREPEGMDAGTAALFPDSFEESELGLVPNGWNVRNVYDVARVIYGAAFASKRFNTEGVGAPLVRIRDLKHESPGVYTDEKHPKGYMIQPGDLVVGMDGEFRAYLWGGNPAWLNQRVCVFAPERGVPAAFVHRSIMPLLAAVEASETATTVIHLGKNDIDRFRVVVPSPKILESFGAVTEPIYARIVENKKTASSLSALRDTLLPRLVSGQLRLLEAEEMFEEAYA